MSRGLEWARGGPRYHQLRQDLLARIRRGEFRPGAQLPSESQLCQQYAVSVTTARRALFELVNEGAVQRRAGVGTMVAPQVRPAHLAFVSLDYQGDAWREFSGAMGELIAGIGEHAWQRNAALTTGAVAEERSESYLRDLIASRSVNGVLIRAANDIRPAHIDILEHGGMPYVVIKRRLANRPMNCVISNDELGARMATQHLLELGHRSIGFICAKPKISLARERLHGYREALTAAGLEPDPALIREEAFFTREMGVQAALALLQVPRPPTAIFAASDTMALGVYEAAHKLDLVIPEQLSLVGYDDMAPAVSLRPPLTTVRTSYYDFGRLAAELLLDLIEGRLEPPHQLVIRPELVIRGSSSKPGRRPPARAARPQTSGPSGRPRIFAAAGGPGLGLDSLAQALTQRGARIAADPQAADACLYHMRLEGDLAEGLARALEFGDRAGAAMSKRGSGSLILIAATGSNHLAARTLRAAGRTALEDVVEQLAARWTSRGVRVNGYLVDGAGIGEQTTACAFLISNDSSEINGTILISAGPRAARRAEPGAQEDSNAT